jgi:hypothetical protein
MSGVSLPEEWRVFKEEFELFLTAISKDDAADKVKVALLLRTIGPRGKDIYDNFTYAAGKSKDNYKDVVDNFDQFCKPRINLFNIRDRFMNTKQKGSSIDEYLTELRKLARLCEFGGRMENLVLHVLVMGLDDRRLVDKKRWKRSL